MAAYRVDLFRIVCLGQRRLRKVERYRAKLNQNYRPGRSARGKYVGISPEFRADGGGGNDDDQIPVGSNFMLTGHCKGHLGRQPDPSCR
jgi:hypothetical protein